MKKIFTVLLAVMLFGALSFAKQADQSSTTTTKTKTTKTEKAKAPKTKVAKGKIVSASDTELVIARKMKGQEQNETFALNSSTQKEGDMAAGNWATVHYTSEGTNNTATMVKASAPKAEKASKSKKEKGAAAPQSK